MDTKDKFETHQYSFSGLDDVISQFAEQISGAVGIPLVRLFASHRKVSQPVTLTFANYYDRVSSLQRAPPAPAASEGTGHHAPLWSLARSCQRTSLLSLIRCGRCQTLTAPQWR